MSGWSVSLQTVEEASRLLHLVVRAKRPVDEPRRDATATFRLDSTTRKCGDPVGSPHGHHFYQRSVQDHSALPDAIPVIRDGGGAKPEDPYLDERIFAD